MSVGHISGTSNELYLKWQNFMLRAILMKHGVSISFSNNELAEFYIMATSKGQMFTPPVANYVVKVDKEQDGFVFCSVANLFNPLDVPMTFVVKRDSNG